MRWTVTADDRGPDGRILVNPFAAEIARAMVDIGAAPLTQPEEGNEHAAPNKRYQLAGIVGGLFLLFALAIVVGRTTPAPAKQR